MVQVAAFWHIMKVPLPAQLASPWPPVSFQSPHTIPLLRLPFVLELPLEVALTPPLGLVVKARVLPEGVPDVTV